jgi:hypothetical protein
LLKVHTAKRLRQPARFRFAPFKRRIVPELFLREAFDHLGVIGDPAALDGGKRGSPTRQKMPVVHRREFPVNSTVVTFH